MISLPLKSTESAKWSTHINSALITVYGSSSSFSKEIEALERLRDAVMGAAPNSKGAQILYRYLAQLELLTLHIPMRPFRTEFTWHNLYGDEVVSQSSIAFEKVCVLFNLAAVLSHTGAEAVSRKDFKTAYHDFSCAAGILEFSSLNFLFTASVDVDAQTLSTLSELMLAQAQHCFYLKARSSPTSNHGLLAKLASSAASLYNNSYAKLRLLYDDDRWGDKTMLAAIDLSMKNLRAQAQLEQATHCEESTHKYGDAIAHLKEARRLILERPDKSQARAEADELTTKLRSLERNNDLIYHERVPAKTPEVKATLAAKALPLESVFSEDVARQIVGRDLFENVIPIAVHEKASLYSEMKVQLLRDQQEKADIAGLELSSALEFMKLPSSISELRQPITELVEVPPEVTEWSVTVSSVPNLTKPEFNEQRQRILSLVKSQQAIDSTSVIENIHLVKQSLLSATQSDNQLLLMYDDLKLVLPVLNDRAELSKSYTNCLRKTSPPDVSLLDLNDSEANSASGRPKELDSRLDEVASLVAKLHKIQAERSSTLKDLRDRIHQDDATQLIVANQDSPDIEKTILEPELRKFDPLLRRLDATIRLQKSVLNDIAGKWKAVLSSTDTKSVMSEREEVQNAVAELTSKYKSAFTKWQALIEGIERARAFYSDLEHRALNLGSSSQPPSAPPKPQIPSKTPRRSPGEGLSGYVTPSAYNPSMYD